MDRCVVCGGNEFHLEAGFYFCNECQTQQQGKREEVVEFRSDLVTRVRKIRIRKEKSSSVTEEVTGWTSWEKYNFILIGLTNELIALGADPGIKLTVLQLWAMYLKKLEVAFVSTVKVTIPKLSRGYAEKDAEIIYGRIKQRKKKRKRSTSGSGVSGTSVVSSSDGISNRELGKQKKLLIESEYEKYMKSQASSDGDTASVANQSIYSIQSTGSSGPKLKRVKLSAAAKEETKKAKLLAKKIPRSKRRKFEKNYTTEHSALQKITPKNLWGILYLALLLRSEQIHPADMLRYGREGHLSYYRLTHLLPPDVLLTQAEIVKLASSKVDLTHKALRIASAKLANFLEVFIIPEVNLLELMERYVTELQLPKNILQYAKRMFVKMPSKFHWKFNDCCIPNYEARAMAYIIVIIKLFFGLDGITEYENSYTIEKLNKAIDEKKVFEGKLFSFCEWQRYIEYRRAHLVNKHFPTKLKYDPNALGNSHLAVNYLQGLEAKYEGEQLDLMSKIRVKPATVGNEMKKAVERLAANMPEDREIIVFPPSQTPQATYFQKLIEIRKLSYKDNSDFSKGDPADSLPGYMTKPKELVEIAKKHNIKLNIIESSAHFMQKIIPSVSVPRVIQRSRLKPDESVLVVGPTASEIQEIRKTDDPSEYLHRRHPGRIVIDNEKRQMYNELQTLKDTTAMAPCPFGYDQVQSNGQLKINNNSNTVINTDIENDYRLVLSNFERQSLIESRENPWHKPNRRRPLQVRKKLIIKAMKNEENIINDDKSMEKNENSQDVTIVDTDDDEVSILDELKSPKNNKSPEQLYLFRPFNQYWMLRCAEYEDLSHKQMRLIERDLPMNFRWLLHECAHMIETSPDRLYREVALIENYHSDILYPSEDVERLNKYNLWEYRTAGHQSVLKARWLK